jgi:hypothetical protein
MILKLFFNHVQTLVFIYQIRVWYLSAAEWIYHKMHTEQISDISRRPILMTPFISEFPARLVCLVVKLEQSRFSSKIVFCKQDDLLEKRVLRQFADFRITVVWTSWIRLSSTKWICSIFLNELISSGAEYDFMYAEPRVAICVCLKYRPKRSPKKVWSKHIHKCTFFTMDKRRLKIWPMYVWKFQKNTQSKQCNWATNFRPIWSLKEFQFMRNCFIMVR